MTARSRLKPLPTSITPVFSSSTATTTVGLPPHSPRSTPAQQAYSQHLATHYFKRLPTLIFGFVWYGSLWYLIQNVSPEQIQNWPFSNAYGPFQALLFLGNWLVFSFIFLNSRRGLVWAGFCQSLVFLKLQQVGFHPQVMLGLLAFFAIIDVAGTWLENRAVSPKKYANVQKTFHHRRRTSTRTVLQRFG